MADKLDHWHCCQSATRSTVIDRLMVPYYLSRDPGSVLFHCLDQTPLFPGFHAVNDIPIVTAGL